MPAISWKKWSCWCQLNTILAVQIWIPNTKYKYGYKIQIWIQITNTITRFELQNMDRGTTFEIHIDSTYGIYMYSQEFI